MAVVVAGKRICLGTHSTAEAAAAVIVSYRSNEVLAVSHPKLQKPIDLPPKLYQCAQCGFGASTGAALAAHSRGSKCVGSLVAEPVQQQPKANSSTRRTPKVSCHFVVVSEWRLDCSGIKRAVRTRGTV